MACNIFTPGAIQENKCDIRTFKKIIMYCLRALGACPRPIQSIVRYGKHCELAMLGMRQEEDLTYWTP